MHVYYFKFIVLSNSIWAYVFDAMYMGLRYWTIKEILYCFKATWNTDHLNSQIYKHLQVQIKVISIILQWPLKQVGILSSKAPLG